MLIKEINQTIPFGMSYRKQAKRNAASNLKISFTDDTSRVADSSALVALWAIYNVCQVITRIAFDIRELLFPPTT